MATKSVKRKKFKKVAFKLSKSEYEYLTICAKLERTTTNKLIKRYLRGGFDSMRERVEEWQKQKQPENQLNLFDWETEEETPNNQSSMLADKDFLYGKEE